jgi:hypothetical protein
LTRVKRGKDGKASENQVICKPEKQNRKGDRRMQEENIAKLLGLQGVGVKKVTHEEKDGLKKRTSCWKSQHTIKNAPVAKAKKQS